MSNKPTLYIIVIVFIFFILLIVLRFTYPIRETEFINPVAKIFQNTKVSNPTPSISPRPKTFEFDSNTDLKIELDSVNPQVLDSDFGMTSNE